jgi:hypothetical protein
MKDAKKMAAYVVSHKAAQKTLYKDMTQHGLSEQARRYVEEYIRPKKEHKDED